MEEGLRRFESPVAHSLPNRASMSQLPNEATPAGPGRWKECLRRFETPAAHRVSAVGMDLAGSDRHGAARDCRDIDAATLPNWETSLLSILGTSNLSLIHI